MTARRIEVLTDSRKADADLSAKQFYAVKPTSTGVAIAAAAGEPVNGLLGILQNKPVSGVEASVGVLGVYPVLLGGTVSLFDQLTCDSAGKLVRARPGDFILGVALEAGVLNDQKPVFICPMFPADMYFTASDDQSLAVGLAVKAHTVAGQSAIAGAGNSAIGILLANTAQNAAGKVRLYGVCQAVAGTGGVTVGDLLMVEAGGKLVTATGAGKHVVGVAFATIAAGATGTVLFAPRGTMTA